MATEHVRVEVVRATDLTPDDQNANLGTERGSALLETSLRRYGGGRSILVDRERKVIAGNKTLEAAVGIGIDRVVLVHTEGEVLVAVVRDDLDLDEDEEARGLAIADNRVGELNLKWDPEEIGGLREAMPEQIGAFFFPEEMAAIVGEKKDPTTENTGGNVEDVWPEIKLRLHPDAFAQYQELQAMIEGKDEAERFGHILAYAAAYLQVTESEE